LLPFAWKLGEQLAMPLPFSAVPEAPPQAAIGVAPSRNSTFPGGVPEPGAFALTVAVSSVVCPVTDGFVPEVSEVEVSAGLTVWLTVFEVELL
jgi:hypothetical protein